MTRIHSTYQIKYNNMKKKSSEINERPMLKTKQRLHTNEMAVKSLNEFRTKHHFILCVLQLLVGFQFLLQ